MGYRPSIKKVNKEHTHLEVHTNDNAVQRSHKLHCSCVCTSGDEQGSPFNCRLTCRHPAQTHLFFKTTRIGKNDQTVLSGCDVLFFLLHGDELCRPLTGYSPPALRHDHGLVYMCPPFISTCINLRRLPDAMSHFIPLTKWLNDRLLRKLVAHLPAVTACVSNTVTQVIPCRLLFF